MLQVSCLINHCLIREHTNLYIFSSKSFIVLALFFNPFWVNICIGCEIHLILIFCMCWPPHAKNWLIGKDSDAGRDWGQEEKGTTEDEMAGWHHWLNGREFEWARGVGDGQAGLACCDSGGRKESDMTEWLNWTELNWLNYSSIICWKNYSYWVGLPWHPFKN